MTASPWRHLRPPEIFFTLLVLFIFALGLGLRLYDLTDQPIDFHPTRQLRGAIVARGIYYEMDPSADEEARQLAVAFRRSTGQYEPSFLERIVALTYLLLGEEYFWVARIYNSLFWIIGGIALFALTQRIALSILSNKDEPSTKVLSFGTAFISLAYYLVLPFGVQASRSFQPDPGMVVWMVLFIYSLYRWSERQEHGWIWAILTGILAGMAVLTKAIAIYTVAGAIAAVILYTCVLQQTKSKPASLVKTLRNPQVWVMVLLMITPSVIYYLGRGDRASEFFSSWTIALSHLLLEPWFYLRWLNLVQKLMGPVALLLGLAGVLIAKRSNRALLLGLWGGYVTYGLFLPYHMYTHNYYHLQLIPIVALSLAPVALAILTYLSRQKMVWQLSFASLILVWLAYSAWVALVPLYGQDHRDEPTYWQEIASHLPGDGKIIALTQDYGYRLMYYGWRKVTLWPNRGEQKVAKLRGSEKDFRDYFAKRTKDKRYFLITAFKQFNDQPTLKQTLHEHYPVVAEGQGYIIFDLSGQYSSSP